jgi:hypothetical protein
MAIKSMQYLVYIHRFTWSGGYDRLVCLAKPYGLFLCEKLYPQRLHVKRLGIENLFIKMNILNCHLIHFLIAKYTLGQVLYVSPENNTIAIRLGRKWGVMDWWATNL